VKYTPTDWGKWRTYFAWLPVRIDKSWHWLVRYEARWVDAGHLWSEYEWQRRLPGDMSHWSKK